MNRHSVDTLFNDVKVDTLHDDGASGADWQTEAPSKVFAFLRKFWWLLLLLIVLGQALAHFLLSRTVPIYQASSSVEISQSERNIVADNQIEEIIANEEYFETQIELLHSRALAERVSASMDLSTRRGFFAPDSEASERTEANAIGLLTDNITILQIGRSRLVSIAYRHPDPKIAVDVANSFATEFIENNLQRRSGATVYAREFLVIRVQSAKDTLQKSERDLLEYASQNDILNSGTDNSATLSQSVAAATLETLNADLTQTNTLISEVQSELEALRSNGLAGQSENSAIASMRESLRELEVKYLENLGTYKPAHPLMVSLQSQIDFLKAEINDEVSREFSNAETNYNQLLEKRANLIRRIQRTKSNITETQRDSVEYDILKREVDTNRIQYEALLQRLNEVNVMDVDGSNHVSMVDRAVTPGLPVSPRPMRTRALSLILSCLTFAGFFVLLDLMSAKIISPDDVKRFTPYKLLGVIPAQRKKPSFELLNDPNSIYSEAYATLKTNIFLSDQSGGPKTILFVSTRSGEGKSATSYGVANRFAGSGEKVILIDADLRRPSFNHHEENSFGLSELLQSKTKWGDYFSNFGDEPLHVLGAGSHVHNPSELLTDGRFDDFLKLASSKFDRVIIDSPPILGLADSVALSRTSECVIFLIESAAITVSATRQSLDRLRNVNANILGVVLTKFKPPMGQYNYSYSYSYGGDPTQNSKGFMGFANRAGSKFKLDDK